MFARRTPGARRYRVTLQGSLAATGKGHLTDRAIRDGLPQQVEVDFIWAPEKVPAFHPNGMQFEALDDAGRLRLSWQVFSVGGGALREAGLQEEIPEVYPQESADEMLAWCQDNSRSFWQLAQAYEQQAGIDLDGHLQDVWRIMLAAVDRGLSCAGTLPGSLALQRRASVAHANARKCNFPRSSMISAYALAVAEENAAGGVVVTAPTCGSAGIIPAVFRFLMETVRLSEADLLRALATAGLFGNLVKQNASISGAEVGCQGEVGTACAMAAAGAAQLLGGTNLQIEYAAEMGLEHHLGLTCDPVAGLVQIPCIERNVMAALQALSCAEYALLFDGTHRVSFDQVVETMKETGHDLPSLYRETAAGGLARRFADS
jgi:L-serine dehydratase